MDNWNKTNKVNQENSFSYNGKYGIYESMFKQGNHICSHKWSDKRAKDKRPGISWGEDE